MDVHKSIAYLRADLSSASPDSDMTLEGDDAPILKRIAPGLLTAYLIDEGDSFTYVQQRHLREAGIGQDELHALAVSNLAQFADGKVTMQPIGSAWTLFCDGNFEASLVLLDDLWTRGLSDLAPDPVVAIPARDVLAFCDAASAEGIAELREVVKRVWPGGDHLIAEQLYRRVDGNWRVHD